MKLKCYSITFEGHYPVDTSAIVFATSPQEAAEKFEAYFAEHEQFLHAVNFVALSPYNHKPKLRHDNIAEWIEECPIVQGAVYVLSNGNY